ncbi:MAG TPA: homoserine kinase [Actinomycetota bacterium]|nr:homoserine kinase [Actinomycetota bacterium]
MRLRAVVPATSANLGPGFDCFGLALDLCNEVTLDTEARPGVRWDGEGAQELPTDGTDVVSRAIAAAVERRRRHHPEISAPPFGLYGVNRIPLERGLGSSSAAAVAGTALAAALLGPVGWEDLPTTFAYAAELEGHPDNAAPAAFGGLTVIADGGVHRLDVHRAIRPVVLVPQDVRTSTTRARRELPARVLLADAIYNVAHGALAVRALTSGDLDLLLVSLRDRLHERIRLSSVPAVEETLDRLRRSQVPACVSGSGPSLLAFEGDGRPVPHPGPGWQVLPLAVRATGAEVIREG